MNKKIFIDNQEVEIPDVRIRHMYKGCKTFSNTEYKNSLFVKNKEGIWIGWISKDDAYRCQNNLCNPRVG